MRQDDAGVTFRATVELAGRTATGVTVPAAAVEALSSQRQPLVHVTIGSHTYRSKLAVRGGDFKLPISAENRAGAGIASGDDIELSNSQKGWFVSGIESAKTPVTRARRIEKAVVSLREHRSNR